VTSGDRVASPVTGARKALTSGTRLPEREIVRERGGSAADGWGRAGSSRGERSAGARAMGRLGRERGECGREREREGLGRKRPSRGGFLFHFSIFYFLFLFLIPISFISFSFEQIIS
jgi:hypothetical protein